MRGGVFGAFLVCLAVVVASPIMAVYLGVVVAYAAAALGLLVGLYAAVSSRGSTARLLMGFILVSASLASLAASSAVPTLLPNHGVTGAGAGGGVSSTSPGVVSVRVGEPVNVGDVSVLVEGVGFVDAVDVNGTTYAAPEGERLVVVRLVVVNRGRGGVGLDALWGFSLVTGSSAEYREARLSSLLIKPEAARRAARVALFDPSARLGPGERMRVVVLFLVPVGEEPERLVMRVGGGPPRVVVVRLSG